MSVICKGCGYENAEASGFCENCGAALSAAEKEDAACREEQPTETPPQPTETPPQHQEYNAAYPQYRYVPQYSYAPPPVPKRSKLTLVAGIIIYLIVCIGSTAAYLYIFRDDIARIPFRIFNNSPAAAIETLYSDAVKNCDIDAYFSALPEASRKFETDEYFDGDADAYVAMAQSLLEETKTGYDDVFGEDWELVFTVDGEYYYKSASLADMAQEIESLYGIPAGSIDGYCRIDTSLVLGGGKDGMSLDQYACYAVRVNGVWYANPYEIQYLNLLYYTGGDVTGRWEGSALVGEEVSAAVEFEFCADGTVTLYENDAVTTVEMSGTYSVEGYDITLVFPGRETAELWYTVNGDQLTIQNDDGEAVYSLTRSE